MSTSSTSTSSAKKNEYKYIINSHGGIITSNEGNVKKYMAIKIPTNVEIFTYSNLGQTVWSGCAKNYFICDNLDKVTSHGFMVETPIHKYSYKSNSRNIFPEVFLSGDTKIPLGFYSGIVHCIPKHSRTTKTKTKTMEVIYNIDALVKQNCDKTTIGKAYKTFGPETEENTKLYNTEKQYSTYYKTQLKDYIYDPKSKDTKDTVSNKCGPLLLSQAIKVIQAHWKATYPEDLKTSTIQIYLSCCLGEKDIAKHYQQRDCFLTTNETKYKELLAELDIVNKHRERDDKQMENYYKIKEGYYSLDIKSLINNSLYTTDLEEFDSSKTSEEDKDDGFSYSYFFLAKQIILIVSKKDTVKYEEEAVMNYRKIIDDALGIVITDLNHWYIPLTDLPDIITIDSRTEIPTTENVYKKLLQVIINNGLNSKLKYTLGSKKYTIEVHLEHDTDSNFKNETFSERESVILKQVDRVKRYKINGQSIFNIVKNYTIKLKLSDLKKDDNELYDKMIEQVKETAAAAEAAAEAEAAEETAAAQQRELMQSVRKEAAEAAAREAAEAAEAAAREASREAKARETAAREARETAAREAEAREAREAEAREAEAREAEAREAEKNKTTRKQPILGPTRTRVRVAPEPDDIKPIKSKNRLRTVIQGLRSLFYRKSRKVVPEPSSKYKASGIKTKFKRKRGRRISRNRVFSKIKTHVIPLTYRKKKYKTNNKLTWQKQKNKN